MDDEYDVGLDNYDEDEYDVYWDDDYDLYPQDEFPEFYGYGA